MKTNLPMSTVRLVLILLIVGSSCQNKPKQETKTEQTVPPVDLTKRPDENAPRSSADRLIRALYFEHDKTENPFLAKNLTLAEQYFTKPMAALLVKKAPAMNANRKKINPLFNEADANVQKRWVLPALIAGDKAVVFVTYQTAGKEKEMRVELAPIGNDRWRIADIVYTDGTRLTALLH